MPMPRLLKKLSHKSLRRRSQSVDVPESPKRAASEPVPPLPPNLQGDRSLRFVSVSSVVKTLPILPPNGDEPHEKSSTTNENLRLPPIPAPPVAQDDLSNELAGAWAVASKDPKVSKADKMLQKLEDGVTNAQGIQGTAMSVVTGVTAILDATGGMQAIEQGINHFLEGSTVLMNALDEVAKLHPFVSVAILAFKAVWTLEMKRRENDKKIITLHVEMKEMMKVLLQLKAVKDPDAVAPDGSTIKDRMEELVKGTAKDIKDCANACDTYSKKKLVVKVLKGPIWEPRLLRFIELFTKRRTEFEFALTIHTSLGVDAANRTLVGVEKTTQELNAKMDLFMKMFQNFAQPEEKELARLVELKGGTKACQENEKALRELYDFEQTKTGFSGVGQSNIQSVRKARRTGPGAQNSEFDDLVNDLHVDPDVALEKNMAVFSRKFEVQKRQIVEELSHVVKREGDRVISAVTSGPHDKIIDPDVHKIWKEMGWRGSVKARHFVLALRDYFQEKWGSDGEHPEAMEPFNADNVKSDEWALAYLNPVRLQPVTEAFDDDASGFVTVAEVNTFTISRPIGWSLPHWIAYWAIGWHQSMALYEIKIREIVAKIFAVLPNILPANRASVDEYLASVYVDITTVQSSLNVFYVNESLHARFKSYVEAEETRLVSNLEAVNYDIDARDTLALVIGPGRIERFVLPLIYLLLKRHFEIIRVCQKKITHPDELWDASDTMRWLLEAVSDRVGVLQSIFKQQNLNLEQHFKTFAHGLFEYSNNPSLLWDDAAVKEAEYLEYPYDDAVENQDVKLEDILNYPVDQEELDLAAYESPLPAAPTVDHDQQPSPLDALLGMWNGFIYWSPEDEAAGAGMISMVWRASSSDGYKQRFEAAGRSDDSDFSISGECSTDETGDIIVEFKRTFPARFATQCYYGRFDAENETLTGKWGYDDDHETYGDPFIFKRTAPEYLCFWPAPAVFEANKARALWSFAISAISYQVRRRLFPRLFFKQRRDNRKHFIELYIRFAQFGRPLDNDETLEFMRLRQTFTNVDSRFYHSLAHHQIRRTTGHQQLCDNCNGIIGGARLICLDCRMKDEFNTIDLCEAPDCVVAQVDRDDLQRTHLPTHDLMKVRRVVHTRQFGKLDRGAKDALQAARAAFGRNQISDATAASENPSASNSVQKETPTDMGAGLTCMACKSPVTQPCWYCVQCPGGTFICNDCDAKGPLSFNDHDDSHALVRCQERVEDVDISVEERLASLEEQFTSHRDTMDERLGQLGSKVDDRLSQVDNRLLKVENLLEALLMKIGTEPMAL